MPVRAEVTQVRPADQEDATLYLLSKVNGAPGLQVGDTEAASALEVATGSYSP